MLPEQTPLLLLSRVLCCCTRSTTFCHTREALSYSQQRRPASTFCGLVQSRYLEAWERRHDYDLYCILAGHFWPLEAQAFRACSRPGKKLFLEIQCPARVIQRMWRTCWPFRKVTESVIFFSVVPKRAEGTDVVAFSDCACILPCGRDDKDCGCV